MLTRDIVEKAGDFFVIDEKGEVLYSEEIRHVFSMLEFLSGYYLEVVKPITAVARGEGGALNLVQNTLNSVPAKMRRWSPRFFFNSYENLMEKIERLRKVEGDINIISGHLISLDDFCEAYNSFLPVQDMNASWNLLASGHEAWLRVSSLLDAFRAISHNFHINFQDYSSGDGWGELELQFFSKDSYLQFSNRIRAISDMYSHFCYFAGISEEDFPLRIGRVETGSLWVKVFGESKVISFMISSIESCASFIYRNYTIEGKVSAIPRGVDALNALIGLREKMKSIGVSDQIIDENIKRSAIYLSRDLNLLLAKQGSLKINEKLLSVGDEGACSLLESRPWPKLEHSELEKSSSGATEPEVD